jgi:hypothetical protein
MSTTEEQSTQNTKKKSAGPAANSVRVTGDAFRQLTAKAKDLGLTNMEYASAAITYFTRNGLDPTSQETAGLISMQAKMSEVGLEIRKQNADIGNRLVAIMRTWETNQYKFQQAQQAGVLGYLEEIEANILNHQVAVESQILAPILENLVRSGIETHMTRLLSEMLLLKFKDDKYPLSNAELRISRAEYDEELDKENVLVLQKILKTATVTAPQLTKKPSLVIPTVGSLPKPAGTSAAASATPTPPKS